ncbi:MAG TPA: phasin family protein [Mesorhizobium sp.]|jgi:hypothetical protein|nr:phasin family protein [Mesorhizobium sp.]
MTTIRQLFLESPVKTNELFGKLVDTSEAAVKTREKLFAELKAEIERQAKLEEQNLFPILRKHEETKLLVTEAVKDNRQTRKLLADLERTPKESQEFTSKIADLQKVFQQHVRDEKKELLPAIQKALSAEEASAVVVKIEDAKAEVEAARRAEANERRAEMKSEREAAETASEVVQASINSALEPARAAQEIVTSTASVTREATKRSNGKTLADTQGSERDRDQSTGQATKVEAAVQSGTVVSRSYQDFSQEWLAMSQARFQKNMEGLNAMTRCRSLPELMQAQLSLVRENVELTVANSRRLAELSANATFSAFRGHR